MGLRNQREVCELFNITTKYFGANVQKILDDSLALETGCWELGWAERLFSESFPPALVESAAYHEGRSLRLQVCCVVLQKEKKDNLCSILEYKRNPQIYKEIYRLFS